MTEISQGKTLKKDALRFNEYYLIQQVFDKLYEQSSQKHIFHNLLDIIKSDANLILAYRCIKTNKGSKTRGYNNSTIDTIENMTTEQYLEYMKTRLDNYVPMPVRRVEIPKPNGKTRPLGIPTIEDRLIQQSIKQVLEPICEAKFYPYSFGFRPNRSTEHAIAYFNRKINLDHCHYIVDVDVKGFFDNVNHGKLLKQIWTMGIRDKKLICIISKMLKAPIYENNKLTKPTKGTPQGGILSPLLSNIVLNELDWWIGNQWMDFISTTKPIKQKMRKGSTDNGDKYRSLRKSNLKEMYIVRYADDFKILCKNHKDAFKIYNATKLWLKDRLKLDISDEKSGITNLKRHSTEFLGFSIKVYKKKHKYVVQSHMSEKAKTKVKDNLIKSIIELGKSPTVANVGKYNAKIMGIQNYYEIATLVNIDLALIAYELSKKLKNRIKRIESKTGSISKLYEKRYKNNYKQHFVAGVVLFPLADIQTNPPHLFNQSICDYTEKGRIIIHGKLAYINPQALKYLMTNPPINGSVQLYDNRLSLYAAQKGLCGISGEVLRIGEMDVHHIQMISQGGTDKYKNLIYLTNVVHDLIHMTGVPQRHTEHHKKLVELVREGKIQNLNKYRHKVGNKEYQACLLDNEKWLVEIY